VQKVSLNKSSKVILSIPALFFLYLALTTPSSALTTWVAFDPSYPEGSPPEITVLEHDTEHTTLEINIPGMWVEDVYGAGEVFQKLEIPEYQTILDIGRPALPAIGGFVGFLEPSDTDLTYSDGTPAIVLQDYLVYPAQTPQADYSYSNNPYFDYDWEFYQQDIWYPDERANVSETMIMRDVCIEHFGVIPFEYNPAQRQLIVHHNMTVDVFHYPNERIYSDWTRLNGATPEFVNMYSSTICNYDWLGLVLLPPPEYDYLIVTISDFSDAAYGLEQFLEETRGYRVKVLCVGSGWPWELVYEIIQFQYQVFHITYVLLIGDTDYIDIPIRQWYNPQEEEIWDIPSDIVYAGLAGDDVIPDVALGRLSVNSSEKAKLQVSKIKQYYNYYDETRMLRTILFSHKGDDQEEEDLFYGTICDIMEREYYFYDPEFVAYPGQFYHSTNSIIISLINAWKPIIVSYYGHGEPDGYYHWNKRLESFGHDQIVQVEPGPNRPIFFSVSCETGKITIDNCFCEDWMNVSGGAVGAIGASMIVHSPPDNQFIQWFFRVLYDRDQGNLGIVLNWAKLEMLKTYYGGGYWEYAIESLLAYILLGDPSLNILPSSSVFNLQDKERNSLSQEEKATMYVFQQPTVKLYPNPVSDILNIKITTVQSGYGEFKLYDLSGRLVTTQSFSVSEGGSSQEINLNYLGLESGIYIVQITAPGISERRKVVFAP